MTRKQIALMTSVLLLLVLGAVFLIRHQAIDHRATVVKGQADLRNSPITEEVLRLDGTWRFQSNAVTEVSQFSYRTIPYVTPYPQATYEIDVALPPGQFALRIPATLSNATLLIDGEPVTPVFTSIGNQAKQSYLVLLDEPVSTFRLTMQMADLQGDSSSVEESILIGPINQMMAVQNTFFSYDFIILLISFLIFSFYAIVYTLHRTETIYLYGTTFFFMTSLSLAIHNGLGVTLSDGVANRIVLAVSLLSVCMLLEFARRIERVPFDQFLIYMRYPIYVLSALVLFIPSGWFEEFQYFAWIFVLFMTFFWIGLNVNWLVERTTKHHPFEFLLFTVTLLIGYIGLIINTFVALPNQYVYTNIFSIIYFLLMFLLLPIHLSTDKQEKEEVEVRASQNEMSFFNAQIKPHFLYNTFGNVIALCYTAPHEAARLLSHLSTYVRFIFESGRTDTNITLRQELNMIDSYLAIEQTRFNDSFTILKEVDDAVLDWQVPPLLIQPLVENAIRHGLPKKVGSKRLLLSIQIIDDALDIRVADNGIGFDTKKQCDEAKGIGLLNIQRRIEYVAGGDFTLHSEIGAGTNVHIRLPRQERTNDRYAYDFD